MDSKDENYKIFSDAMTFTLDSPSFSYIIDTPKDITTDCFSLLTLDPSDDSNSLFNFTYEGTEFPFSS